MQLTITNNSASNPLTLDLSQYIRVEDGAGMDVANPAFTQRVYTRSLLKEGASLALTQFTEKELQFPLLLGPVGGLTGAPQTMGAVAALIAQVNQVLETPGATCTWKPDGVSQATTFDIIVGQFEVAYSFRKEEAHWTEGNLRIFTQPFGRTAGPRLYATASGVGPVLMISPYRNAASGGQLIIGQSTQAGVAGYGGAPMGGSSGVFYWGSPSLAGDAPPTLKMTVAPGLAGTATVPSAYAVSLLPDSHYMVLPPQVQLTNFAPVSYGASTPTRFVFQFPHPGSQAGGSAMLGTLPFTNTASEPTIAYAGQHRLLALARASGTWCQLYSVANELVSTPTTASVAPQTDFSLYDLGTFSIRGSVYPGNQVLVGAAVPSVAGVGLNAAVDIGALIMLPDSTTWFMGASGAFDLGGLLIDDTLGEQYSVFMSAVAMSPASVYGGPFAYDRSTQYSRGLVPRPDPKNGPPAIAVLAVGASTISPLATLNAQVQLSERARYTLP